MSVQRILPLPDKGPCYPNGTYTCRVKMQEIGVDNLRLSKEYGQLVWGGSTGSSSRGKEELPFCLWLKKEEETDGDTETFGYGGQWGNSHQLLLTFSAREVLGREAWVSLDIGWTAHYGDAISPFRQPDKLLPTLQDSNHLLCPPKCQGRVEAVSPTLVHLFFSYYISHARYNYFCSHLAHLSVWSPRRWRLHHTLYTNFSAITLVQNDMQ